VSSAQTVEKDIRESIYDYMRSDGPGGMRVINAFLDEFEKLSERSPQDDPTNIKNHIPFIVKHLKDTWDESLTIDRDGNVSIGLCKDEVLGFEEDKEKLKHNPSPVVWTVYLIRGIGGRYAFINPQLYARKYGESMPSEYFGGFLISKWAWDIEGWDEVGSFEQYEHPASGAAPIPFFRNVIKNIDMQSIIADAIEEAQK
jgi:hypothetical protein